MANQVLKQSFPLIQQFFQYLSYFAFLLAAFSLNFPMHISNIFLFSWMVLNAADVVFRGKYHFERPNKDNLQFYFLIALYLWMVVSLLWTTNLADGQKFLFHRVSLLIFPLFALFGLNKYYKLTPVFFVFILGSLLSIITLVVFGYIKYKQMPEMFVNLGQFTEYIFSLYKHRTYFSLCLIFSLLFYFYLKEKIIAKTSSVFYYVGLGLMYALFFGVIYFSLSRMSLIIYLVIAVFSGITFLIEKGYVKTMVVFALLFISLSTVLVMNQPRMRNLDMEKLQQFDPRYDLWRNSVECIQQSNWLVGVGVGDYVDVFNENHSKEEFKQYFYPTDNSHNEFLKTQIESGIIGNLLLIGVLISILLTSRKKTLKVRSFLISVVMIWFLFMLIETIGLTSSSTYLFAFSLLIAYMIKSEKERQTGKPSRELEFKQN